MEDLEKIKQSERNKGRKEGLEKGERNIILRLLKNHSVDSIAEMLETDSEEIYKHLDTEIKF